MSTGREAAAKLRTALDLYEVGEQMQRSRLRRENPDADEATVEAALVRWRLDRPNAPYGDHPGRPSGRII
jgi:hypothetical protein